MTIEKQIAIVADEPEQYSATEMLNLLLKNEYIFIDNCFFDVAMITDTLEKCVLEDLAAQALLNHANNIREIYITAIQGLME